MPATSLGAPVSRRTLLRMCAAAAASSPPAIDIMTAQGQPAAAGTIMDHLLLGAADLDEGVAWAEHQTGVRAVLGGSHPGAGTRNALISLGRQQYLEIIAPDPAQPATNLTRNAQVRALAEPRLIGWAVASADVDLVAREVHEAGLEVFGPRDGSRARPDGRVLRWRIVGVSTPLGGGDIDLIPFFIQWGAGSVHPSDDSPPGCSLEGLEFRHPDPEALRRTLRRLGIDARVTRAPVPAIAATLGTPKGHLVIS